MNFIICRKKFQSRLLRIRWHFHKTIQWRYTAISVTVVILLIVIFLVIILPVVISSVIIFPIIIITSIVLIHTGLFIMIIPKFGRSCWTFFIIMIIPKFGRGC